MNGAEKGQAGAFLRERILSEVSRLANLADGKAPGVRTFSRATGISEHEWRGVFWSKWSDAVAEAGCSVNVMQARFSTADVLVQVIGACRHYGHIPTVAEMKLYRRANRDFPSKGAVAGHFPAKADLLRALNGYARTSEGCSDILAMVAVAMPDQEADALKEPRQDTVTEGHVYLLKSGSHYKIGRSEQLERRVKEVRVALPEAVILEHAIRTDDPAGIEAYWHRRFAERRANGEWFKLSAADVLAFKRRRFQ